VTKSVIGGTCCKLFSVLDDKCWRPERKLRATFAYKMLLLWERDTLNF